MFVVPLCVYVCACVRVRVSTCFRDVAAAVGDQGDVGEGHPPPTPEKGKGPAGFYLFMLVFCLLM